MLHGCSSYILHHIYFTHSLHHGYSSHPVLYGYTTATPQLLHGFSAAASWLLHGRGLNVVDMKTCNWQCFQRFAARKPHLWIIIWLVIPHYQWKLVVYPSITSHWVMHVARAAGCMPSQQDYFADGLTANSVMEYKVVRSKHMDYSPNGFWDKLLQTLHHSLY